MNPENHHKQTPTTTTKPTESTHPTAVLNRIRTDANKQPWIRWQPYQTRLVTPEEFAAWKEHPKAHGEAIICGKISGGLEVIDIDTKHDPAGTLHTDYFSVIRPELFKRLHIVNTRSGGAHIYYRCEEIGRNTKLAHRQPTPEERAQNPQQPPFVLIETRGEAGYIVAPPTPGYTIYQGTPETIPTITPAERAELLELARSFSELMPVIPEPLKRYANPNERDTGNPFEEYNAQATPEDVRNILEGFGWTFVRRAAGKDYYRRPGKTDAITSGDYHHEKKLFGVFSTSTEFETEKGYSPAAVLNVLKFGGDWKETARFLRAEGFGQTKKGEELKAINRAAELLRKNKPEKTIIKALVSEEHAKDDKQAAELIKAAEKDAEKESGEFWNIDRKGNVSFSWTAFFSKLQSWGYYRLSGTKGVYIKSTGKVISETTPADISERVLQYLRATDAPGEVEEHFRKCASQLLADATLERNIPAREPRLLRDTENEKYLAFTNGLAVMDKAGNIKMIPYQDAPGEVWESTILTHHFEPDKSFIFALADCEFYQFLRCIAGEHETPATERPRTDYAVRVFGYLCHNHKNVARPWAVILSEETDSEEKGGGTGKGLFMHAVHRATGTGGMVTIPGKDYAPDNRFVFSRVTNGTAVVFLDDAGKRFNFEGLYNAITEGLRFEKKGQDERYLPFEVAPKFAVSTNYAITLDAEHAARRARVLEFAGTFGKRLTPLHYFGHRLFYDWDEYEWNRFYNLVFHAVSEYLCNPEGIEIKPPSIETGIKRIRIDFGRDFVSWIEEKKTEWTANAHPIPRQVLYDEFLTFTGFEPREYGKKKFYAAMDAVNGLPGLGVVFKNARAGNSRGYLFGKAEDETT